jgi:hypothetical protein
MKSQFVDGAFRRILAQRRGVAPGPCPDANEFAAYLEAGLTPEETARFEEHASNCQPCQEALALSLTLAEEETGVAGRPLPEPRRFTYRSSPLRFALAAVVLLTVGVFLFRATREAQLVSQGPQFARREAGGDMSKSGSALSAPPGGEPQPATGTPPVPRESAGTSPIPAKAKDLAASQPPRPPGNPAGLVAPAPTIALDAASAARSSQVAAKAEAKADVPKPAVGEGIEDLQKAQRAQLDAKEQKNALAFRQADEIRMQVTVSGQQNAVGQARAGNVQQMAVQAGAEAAPAQVARVEPDNRVRMALQEASATADKSQKFGNRLFLRTTNYWVEVECTLHREAPAREITRDSKEFTDMLAKEPAFAELPKGPPVLLFWNGANLLVR